jgi:hypothetical protein
MLAVVTVRVGPMEPRPVSGYAMLVATLLLLAVILALSFLAGPFGRTPTIRQEPVPHHGPEEQP